jgi:hypothetical protein
MLRAGRREDALRLLGQVLGLRDDRSATIALVHALAAHYQTPQLEELLARAEPVPSES